MRTPGAAQVRLGAARSADRPAPARSLIGAVYQQLREEVLSGALRPGEKLLITPLAARYGVSASVIREELSRLTAWTFGPLCQGAIVV